MCWVRRAIADQIKTVQARTLVLVGDSDLLIPSREEGPRLQKLLPRCVLRVLPPVHCPAIVLDVNRVTVCTGSVPLQAVGVTSSLQVCWRKQVGCADAELLEMLSMKHRCEFDLRAWDGR